MEIFVSIKEVTPVFLVNLSIGILKLLGVAVAIVLLLILRSIPKQSLQKYKGDYIDWFPLSGDLGNRELDNETITIVFTFRTDFTPHKLNQFFRNI